MNPLFGLKLGKQCSCEALLPRPEFAPTFSFFNFSQLHWHWINSCKSKWFKYAMQVRDANLLGNVPLFSPFPVRCFSHLFGQPVSFLHNFMIHQQWRRRSIIWEGNSKFYKIPIHRLCRSNFKSIYYIHLRNMKSSICLALDCFPISLIHQKVEISYFTDSETITYMLS